MGQKTREEILLAVSNIINRFEDGNIAVYEEANDLIAALGGEPIVTRGSHHTSVLNYINALTLRYILEEE